MQSIGQCLRIRGGRKTVQMGGRFVVVAITVLTVRCSSIESESDHVSLFCLVSSVFLSMVAAQALRARLLS